MNLISAENLLCERGGGRRGVFANLSFAVGAGELVHLQGANGAGKSSLLRVCAGLLTVLGGLERQAAFHFIAAHNCLHPKLNVADNIGFWARLFGVKDFSLEGVDGVLALWGLESLAALYPANLSAGQAQALSLARLALAPRPLWLLDEAFSNLDKKRSAILQTEIEKHLQQGGGVMIAEHNKNFGAALVINMDAF